MKILGKINIFIGENKSIKEVKPLYKYKENILKLKFIIAVNKFKKSSHYMLKVNFNF
jgi:hypothetical protein